MSFRHATIINFRDIQFTEVNQMKKLYNIAIYSRKSKFTGKGESIDNQIELCRQYIRTHYPGSMGEHQPKVATSSDTIDDNILIYEDEGFPAAIHSAHNSKK